MLSYSQSVFIIKNHFRQRPHRRHGAVEVPLCVPLRGVGGGVLAVEPLYKSMPLDRQLLDSRRRLV